MVYLICFNVHYTYIKDCNMWKKKTNENLLVKLIEHYLKLKGEDG